MNIRYFKDLIFLSMFSSATFAGGFSLYTESSAAEVGVFAAGSAAEAMDASIGWYNPAGLILCQQDQAVLSGVGVLPVTRITGESIYATEGVPSYVQSFSGLSGGQQAVVPALHVAHPLGPRAVFGFSVVSPFGLSTQWSEDSPVRYAATLTKLVTVDLSPEMGVLLHDHLSFGAGLDWEYADVQFNGVGGSPAALQFLQSFGVPVTPMSFDSASQNEGSSLGVGYHVGLLSFFNHRHTRLGLNYQSAITHAFRGSSVLTGPLASSSLTDPTAVFTSRGLYSQEIGLPDIATLSAYQDIAQQWTLLGSIMHMGWHGFKTITLYQVAGYSAELGDQALLNISVAEHYRDTWRAALGVNYHVNDRWMLRLGGGYDQTPTVNAERDVRLPDGDRWAISSGMHYQFSKLWGLDIGYAYLGGLGQPRIDKTQTIDSLSSFTVQAKALNHAQLAAIQAVWNLDEL